MAKLKPYKILLKLGGKKEACG